MVKTQVRTAVATAVSALLGQGVWAQTVATGAAELPKVEITGSHIARLEDDSTTPLQVISRQQIELSGAKTVKEALVALVPYGGGSNEMGTSGFTAPGYDGFSIGLMGENSTLILLNFRRVAPYPLAQNSYIVTNVNALPLEAVERIEILKSGAAAIYGSEAIQGVINIITRPGFEGVKVRLQHEHSQHAGGLFSSNGATVSLGHGNFANDGFNVMSNIELYQRNPVNWRDALEYINPVYFDKFPSLGSLSTYSYPGNLIGNSPRPIPGCDPGLVVGGLCRYDRYKRFELIAPAQRATMYNSAQFHVSGDTTGFAELLLADTRTQYMNPFPVYGAAAPSGQWVVPSSGAVQTFTVRGLPSTHPLNTFGEDELQIRYRFADAPSETLVRTLQYRALAGLRGTWDQLDWEAAVGAMGGNTQQRDRGTFSLSGFRKVIGNDDPSQTDPQFFNRDYKIGQVNSPAVINTLFPAYGYDGNVTHYFADARLNGDVFDAPGGKARVALGADLRHEKHSILPTDLIISGDIIGAGMRNVDDSRNVGALFGELSIPVSKSTTLEMAGRVDKYSGFDVHFSPKLGVRFTPNPTWTVRGTVETGFRAPNLLESANSVDVNFQNGLTDPKRCNQAQALATDLRAKAATYANTDPQFVLLNNRADTVVGNECDAAITTMVKGNSKLVPETAVVANLGLVFHPAPKWSLSADVWSVRRNNEISQKSILETLQLEDQMQAGSVARSSFALDPSFTAAERAKYSVTVGPLQSITSQFANGAATISTGVDLELQSQLKTDLGMVELSANATVNLEYRTFSLAQRRYLDNMAGLQIPRWLGNFRASLRSGDLTHAVTLHYSASTVLYTNVDDGQFTPADCAARGWSLDQCRVTETQTVDYAIAYRGVKNLVVSGYIRNLFDRHNALNLRSLAQGGGGVIPQGFVDVQGRVIGASAEYRF